MFIVKRIVGVSRKTRLEGVPTERLFIKMELGIDGKYLVVSTRHDHKWENIRLEGVLTEGLFIITDKERCVGVM
jgi:hypothetical protein